MTAVWASRRLATPKRQITSRYTERQTSSGTTKMATYMPLRGAGEMRTSHVWFVFSAVIAGDAMYKSGFFVRGTGSEHGDAHDAGTPVKSYCVRFSASEKSKLKGERGLAEAPQKKKNKTTNKNKKKPSAHTKKHTLIHTGWSAAACGSRQRSSRRRQQLLLKSCSASVACMAPGMKTGALRCLQYPRRRRRRRRPSL
jgi:hypothetical protein